MKAAPLEAAPYDALRKCMAIYRIQKPPSKLEEVLANLVFDSWAAEAVAGVRGSDDTQQFHLQTDTVDVHLIASGSPCTVVGQLLGRNTVDFIAGSRVTITHDGLPIETTVTDQLGEFRFAHVPIGRARIQADLPSGACLIGELTLGATQ
jgi:hypothetical protein